MSKQTSNVDIITQNWEKAILKLNSLSYALSTDIITGNSTYSNTGNTTVYKTSQLYGTFGANNIIVTDTLKGGNVNGGSANLVITTNVVVSNTSSIYMLGNSTVNTTINSTAFYTGNSTVNAVYKANTIAPSATLTIANSISVTGQITTTANVIFGGNSISIANTLVKDVIVNTDIGSNTTSPVLLYRFPKANYSSGKLVIQIQNTGNTQISEMVLAHDNTTAAITVYGSVASPIPANSYTSPLGTFTANVNSANIEILINQTVANSAVKIVAELIK